MRYRWLIGAAIAAVVAWRFYEVQSASAFCFFITDHCEIAGIELPTLADAGAVALGALMGILDAIVNALTGLISHIVDLLPDAGDLGLTIPSGWIIGYTWIDRIVPLHEALVWMGVLAAASVAPIAFHLAIAAYHLIPKPLSGT